MTKFTRNIPLLAPVNNGLKRPLVSVLIPTYKREMHVIQAVAGMLAQSVESIEVIVADDYPNNTNHPIQEIRDPRLKYVKNTTNLGVPGNINSCLERSIGEFILVFHDSDIPSPGLVKKMLEIFRLHRNVMYVHTGLKFLDNNESDYSIELGDFNVVTSGRVWLKRMLGNFSSEVSAVTMAPRAVYERYGIFDSKYGFYADIEWAIRMCNYGDVGYISEPLVAMRARGIDHPFNSVRWECYDWLACMRESYFLSNSFIFARIRFWAKLQLKLIIALNWCRKNHKLDLIREGSDTLDKHGCLVVRVFIYFLLRGTQKCC